MSRTCRGHMTRTCHGRVADVSRTCRGRVADVSSGSRKRARLAKANLADLLQPAPAAELGHVATMAANAAVDAPPSLEPRAVVCAALACPAAAGGPRLSTGPPRSRAAGGEAPHGCHCRRASQRRVAASRGGSTGGGTGPGGRGGAGPAGVAATASDIPGAAPPLAVGVLRAAQQGALGLKHGGDPPEQLAPLLVAPQVAVPLLAAQVELLDLGRLAEGSRRLLAAGRCSEGSRRGQSKPLAVRRGTCLSMW